MDTQECGRIIKKMVKGLIYILMDKSIMEVGLEIKKMDKDNIDIKMGMYIKGLGKMIEGMVMAL